MNSSTIYSDMSGDERQFDVENITNKDAMMILAHSYHDENEKENWDPYRKQHTRAQSAISLSTDAKNPFSRTRRNRSPFGDNARPRESGRLGEIETQISVLERRRRRSTTKTPFKEVLVTNGENDSSHQLEKSSHPSPVNVMQFDDYLALQEQKNESGSSLSRGLLHRRVQSSPFNHASACMAARNMR